MQRAHDACRRWLVGSQLVVKATRCCRKHLDHSSSKSVSEHEVHLVHDDNGVIHSMCSLTGSGNDLHRAPLGLRIQELHCLSAYGQTITCTYVAGRYLFSVTTRHDGRPKIEIPLDLWMAAGSTRCAGCRPSSMDCGLAPSSCEGEPMLL
jgi:hypothetical protein